MYFIEEPKIAIEPIRVFINVEQYVYNWDRGCYECKKRFVYGPNKYLHEGRTYTDKRFYTEKTIQYVTDRDYKYIRYDGFVSALTFKEVQNYWHQTCPTWRQFIVECEIPVGATYIEGYYYANPLQSKIILSDKIKIINLNY